MSNRDKLALYQQVGLESEIVGASPHRLIQLLYQAAIAEVAQARASLAEGAIEQRGQHINKLLAIINGLSDSLDTSIDSNLPHDLARLYDYMQQRILDAHRQSDDGGLQEVAELLSTIKSGWDGISAQP